MEPYSGLLIRHSAQLKSITARYNVVSAARVAIALIVIAAIYLSSGNHAYMIVVGAGVIGFALLMKYHEKLSSQSDFIKALIKINSDEINFLQGQKNTFPNGDNFTDGHHMYTYDLDIFGPHSLYANLNRTQTYMGAALLSHLLKGALPLADISNTQQAIQELTPSYEWRHHLAALAAANPDNELMHTKLLLWCKQVIQPVHRIWLLLKISLPVILVSMIVVYVVTDLSIFKNICFCIVGINLLIVGSHAKQIKKELNDTGKIHRIIMQYSLVLHEIEKREFKSVKLQQLQQQLIRQTEHASVAIRKLSSLLSQLQNIENAFGAALMNGLLLYHVGIYNQLVKWRHEHGNVINNWLGVIGEMEALCSLANFAYNNPSFAFPLLNQEHEISFVQAGHPLLPQEQRICNDVSFNPHRLMIITGSNMSGKSTFLRTLGVNMVLAGAGAPVCALKANVHPMDILVSMRIADSLSESESYFFAEVKKLQRIMLSLQSKPCFVLLDEILRGTNSDDKRTGTIEVIRKLVACKALGAIATHDLEVCNTRNEYPAYIANKCFEVQITGNELVFDYHLLEGICKNKSATFMMKKLGVI